MINRGRQLINQQILHNLLQKLVALKQRRKCDHQIEYLIINAFSMLGGATLIEVQQPLQIINQIILQILNLSLFGANTDHPGDLPTHEVAGRHELMRVELMIVLLLYGRVDVLLAAVADLLLVLAAARVHHCGKDPVHCC